MFGAWKILDLVVEYALPPAAPSGNHWSIAQKVTQAQSQTNLTPWAPFAAGDPEWDAALHMYAARHPVGVTHRQQREHRVSWRNPLVPIGHPSPPRYGIAPGQWHRRRPVRGAPGRIATV